MAMREAEGSPWRTLLENSVWPSVWSFGSFMLSVIAYLYLDTKRDPMVKLLVLVCFFSLFRRVKHNMLSGGIVMAYVLSRLVGYDGPVFACIQLVSLFSVTFTCWSYKSQLIAFYNKHNPSKLALVDVILDRYKGREADLFRRLAEKYEEKQCGDGGEEMLKKEPTVCIETVGVGLTGVATDVTVGGGLEADDVGDMDVDDVDDVNDDLVGGEGSGTEEELQEEQPSQHQASPEASPQDRVRAAAEAARAEQAARVEQRIAHLMGAQKKGGVKKRR